MWSYLGIVAALATTSIAPQALATETEFFRCTENEAGSTSSSVYHFTLESGGWFQAPALIWEETQQRFELTQLSGAVVEGALGTSETMPVPTEIDHCIDGEMSRRDTFDRRSVLLWCQRHVSQSLSPVPIKFVVHIDRSSNQLTIIRAQSKSPRQTRYNVDSSGSCIVQSAPFDGTVVKK